MKDNIRKNSEDSIISSGTEEIIIILSDFKKEKRKKRKRDETYEQVAKSPQVQYWLNIINNKNIE